MSDQIRIGDRIRDKISGFTGIATGKTEYINGCRQWLISPESLDKDGKTIDAVWIDEQKLEILTAQVHAEPIVFAREREEQHALTGGPLRREPAQTERRR